MKAGGEDSFPSEELHVPDHQLLHPAIGSGSYGKVYLARTLTQAYRAVKIIRRDRFNVERPFRREFDGILKFEPISRTHPGFVSILHVGENQERGYFYYIMELADDFVSQAALDPSTYKPKTLSRVLTIQGRLPLTDCLAIGLSLSDALGCLHQHGLVHRDIKPSNIIFVNGLPKLADIGLVTNIGERVTFVGTEDYLPPEGPGRPTADLYGLGKVLYVISTGQFAAQFDELPSELKPLGNFLQFCQFKEFLRKACAEDARERFQSAKEMHAALRQVMQTPATEVMATPPQPPERPSPSQRDPLHAERAGFKTSGPNPEVKGHMDASRESHPSSAGLPRLCANVCIAYKSNAQPDGNLVEFLHRELVRHGQKVFIDRHLGIGVQWAQEIEAKIRNSDAAVILLSPASIQSEMVEYEVEIAHDAFQQRGKPSLLPIRVAYNGPLPESLGRRLNQFQQWSWNGPEDDERIVNGILHALENPPVPKPALAQRLLEPPGGAVPLDSAFYVVRPVDKEFREAVARRDSIVLVKGARQMGKTSLLARGLEHAREAGAKVVLTDFQMLNTDDLESADKLYRMLAEGIAVDLGHDELSVWDSKLSPNMKFQQFLLRQVLAKIPGHFVWGLDEVDRLFACSFGSEVFGLFRSWHNKRALDPGGPWSRLTLAIAYATEAHLFITDVNQSPFNVGTRLTLEDFTFDQVSDLNRRYGAPLRNDAELAQFCQLVGGHPFLVRRSLHELVDRGVELVELATKADRDEGIFGDHLRRILVMLAKNPSLLQVVRGILRGQPCPNRESFYRLRSAGIMSGESFDEARPRCQVYESYLKHHLL